MVRGLGTSSNGVSGSDGESSNENGQESESATEGSSVNYDNYPGTRHLDNLNYVTSRRMY